MILDRVVSVARLTPDNDNADKEGYVAVVGLESVRMNIQPADAETVAISEGQIGRTFRGFTSVSGIMLGDRVTVSGSNTTYLVRGIEDWYFAPLPHLELILFLGDE